MEFWTQVLANVETFAADKWNEFWGKITNYAISNGNFEQAIEEIGRASCRERV